MMQPVSLDNPVLSAIRDVMTSSMFSPEGGGLTGTLQDGHPESRVLLVVGDNTQHQRDILHVFWNKLNAAFPAFEEPSRRNWLLLDGPDAWLAEGYCGALSAYLANYGNHLQGSCHKGIIVASQNRKLMCTLTFHLQQTPHIVCLGKYPLEDPFQAWLEDEREHSLDELLALMNVPGGHWSGLERLARSLPSE